MNRRLFWLAALTFVSANVIFALQLNAAPALLLVCGALGAAVLTLQRPDAGPAPALDAPVDVRLLAICGLLALALCLLGGEGHFFFPTTDWLVRDAVLADLTSNPSTAPVQSAFEGEIYILRAPVGMYLLPAAFGKVAGLAGAHYALFAQNALLLAILLYLMGVLGGGWRVILLLAAFSGMDVLPVILTSPLPDAAPVEGGSLYDALLHTPQYALAHDNLEWWNGLLNYPSQVSQIFWAPNHALPGCFLAVLWLLALRREIDLAVLGAFTGVLLIWSPLAVVPALVVLPYFAWRAGLRGLARPRVWAGAVCAACFIPVAIYLTLSAASIPAAPLYALPGFALLYLVFLLVKIPHAFFLAWRRREIAPEMRSLLALCVAVLAILPLAKFGPGNDIVMRGAVAPLVILALVFARAALATPRNSVAGKVVLLIVGLGAVTPTREIQRALTRPSYAISACNLITATQQLDPSSLSTNYLTPAVSGPRWLLRAPGRDARVESVDARWCWPDHPQAEELKLAAAAARRD